MNAMLDRLEDASARQQRFVADASHELRSPVTAIRTELEVAQRTATPEEWPAVAERLLAEEARLEAVIADLLLLASLDEGAPMPDSVLVDLADEAREEARRREPDRAAVTIEVDAPAPALVQGSRMQLRRALANLLDNAGRHAGTSIRLSVHERDGRVRVLVDDDGPGIAEAERERVFERFVRLDEHRARAIGRRRRVGPRACRSSAASPSGTTAPPASTPRRSAAPASSSTSRPPLRRAADATSVRGGSEWTEPRTRWRAGCGCPSAAVRAVFTHPAQRRAVVAFACTGTADWAVTVAVGVIAFQDGGAAAVGLDRAGPDAPLRHRGAGVRGGRRSDPSGAADRRRVDRAGALPSAWPRSSSSPTSTSSPCTRSWSSPPSPTRSCDRPTRRSCRRCARRPSELAERHRRDRAARRVGRARRAGHHRCAARDGRTRRRVRGRLRALRASPRSRLLRIRYDVIERPPTERPHVLREVARGHPDRRPATASCGSCTPASFAQTYVRGALNVLMVVVAFDLLDTGESGVAALAAAFGVGGIVGSFAGSLLAGTRHLGRWLVAALALWGAPIARDGRHRRPRRRVGARRRGRARQLGGRTSRSSRCRCAWWTTRCSAGCSACSRASCPSGWRRGRWPRPR